MTITKTNAQRVVTDGLDRVDAQWSRGWRVWEHSEGIARHFRAQFTHIGRGREPTQIRNRQKKRSAIVPLDRESALAIEIDMQRARRIRIHPPMLRFEAMELDSFRVVARAALPTCLASSHEGIFALSHTITKSETSALVPHANNIAIVSWIDLVASAHGDAVGAARESLAQQGRMWFVARHEIDYLAEAFAGESIILATWVESIGRTSLTRATTVLRTCDERVIARASSRWAMVDLSSRRACAIGDEIRDALRSPSCAPSCSPTRTLDAQ